jgi:hypothetical protein
MALKRKIAKTYSIEEMMYIINKEFINNGENNRESIKHYVISPTCHTGLMQFSHKWLLCDSREHDDNNNDENLSDQLYPSFYGSTIFEAVNKCFMAKSEWYVDFNDYPF